jgi:rhomboid protease GluP
MPKMAVTPVLLALNVAIFGLMLAWGVHPMQPTIDDLIRWGANYGPKTTQGEWWRMFTCMFLHIGLLHLLFNMVALWNVGGFMEQLLGSTGFLVLYIVAGLLGSVASVAWNPFVVSAGASGAIFGVYGGLLAFLVRHRDMQQHAFLAALRTNTLAFLGYNLVFGVIQQGIDMAAHLGGLAGGFVCGLALTSRRR